MSLNYPTRNLNVSPAVKAQAELELRRREKLRSIEIAPQASLEHFQSFVTIANPRFRWFDHCVKIANVLIRVAQGELDRVMIFAPPRHGKSEILSRLFSAYYLSLFPDRWVGINSYAADLAYTLSRSSRENFLANNQAVKNDAAAVKHWETTKGGGLWAAGVGGPITGKGFHLGIIDDPLKNAEEANSEKTRANHKEWYPSTFYTREEPGGAIVVMATRWHADDLSGWLLSQESEEEEPERWHIVSLAAIKESDRVDLPPTCTLETDDRGLGEALCPDRYNAEKLQKIKKRIGEYYWNALYRQNPTAKDGDTFKIVNLQIEEAVPAGLRMCRGWDLAASTDKGDYTAGVKLGQAKNGTWWVLDVTRGQWSADTVELSLKQTAALDGREVKIHLPQDPGQAGKSQARLLTRLLAGYQVKAEVVSGDKETRAFSFAAQVNAGNVRLVKAPWNKPFIDELQSFPHGANDDQVDAASDAFNELAGVKGRSFALPHSSSKLSAWTVR